MRNLICAALLTAGLAACKPDLPVQCESDSQCKEGKCVEGFCQVEAPAIESFEASKATITGGQSATLTAVFKNGLGAVDNGVGAVESGAAVKVSPRTTTTYALAVKNSAWPEITQTVTVTVLPGPTITSFTAEPATITAGNGSALTAVFTNGTGTIDQGVGDVESGEAVVVAPAATKTYTLTVTSATGVTAEETVTVTVVPQPVITSFAPESPTIVAGQSTNLVAVFTGGAGSIDKGIGPVESGVGKPVTPANNLITTHEYTLTVTNVAGDSVLATTTVTVVPGPPKKLTVARFPLSGTRVANGSDEEVFTLTVTAFDQYDNRAAGAQVSLGADGSGNIFTPGGPQTTSENGEAIWTLASTKAEMKTVTPSASGATDITPATVTFVAGLASKLAFKVGPANVQAGASISPPVQVAVQDQFGNEVPGATNSIGIVLGNNPGGGVLSGGAAINASNGVATFSGLQVTKAVNGYTLVASSGSLSPATSAGFNVTSGTAAKLAFLQQPTQVAAGAPISPAVTVRILDLNDNLTTSTQQVSLAIGTNPPGNGALSGGAAVAAVGGAATFSNLKINKAGVGYTLVATCPGSCSPSLAQATSAPFTVIAGSPARLKFDQQPTNWQATLTMPAVTVQVTDANTNVTTSTASVAMAIGYNPGCPTNCGTLTGGAAVAAVSGTASFAGLKIDKQGVNYTLKATTTAFGGDGSTAISAQFTLFSAPAYSLVFTAQPDAATAGVGFPVTVAVKDASNVTQTSVNTGKVSLSIGFNAGGSKLDGTTEQNLASGVASFTGLKLNKVGTGYTLSASTNATVSGTAVAPGTSNSFNVTFGPAKKLLFKVQPSNVTAATAISPAVEVSVNDANTNVVTNSTAAIAMGIGTNAGSGALSGTTSVTLTAGMNGVASFTNLKLNKSGSGYTLKATTTAFGGDGSTAVSGSFNVNAGTAARVAFTAQPSNEDAGSNISPAIQVAVADADTNTVTSSTATVRLAIATNPSSATLDGSTQVAAVSGVATFSSVNIKKTGTGYTLTAASTGLTSATSGAFNITPAPKTKLKFTTQPPATATAGTNFTAAATIWDQYNNAVTSAGDAVSLDTLTGPGALQGTKTVNASSGVATFAAINLQQAGTYTLRARSGSLTQDASTTFAVSASSTLSLSVSTIAVDRITGIVANNQDAATVTVTAKDAYGNPISGRTLTLTSSGGSNTDTIAYLQQTTDASGVARATIKTSKAQIKTLTANLSGTGGGPLTTTAKVTFVLLGRLMFATSESEDRISILAVDQSTGWPRHAGHVAVGDGPRNVLVDPNNKFVYVSNYTSNTVSGFTFDPATGALAAISGSPWSTGASSNPWHMAMDPAGKFLYVANIGTDNVSVFTINSTTGVLTAGTAATVGTNPHGLTVDPSGKFLYVANNGSANVTLLQINATTGALTSPNTYTSATQTYAVVVDPTGRFAYVPNYTSHNISAYTVNSGTGALTAISGSPFPSGASTGPVSAVVDPSGRFLYTANYSGNTVGAFTIDQSTGALAAIAGSSLASGATPRWVAMDPSGKYVYVAGTGSNQVSVFSANLATGALTAAGVIRTRTASWGLALSRGAGPLNFTGKFVYTANWGADSVTEYNIDPATGALSGRSGVAVGNTPYSVAVHPSGKWLYTANSGAGTISMFSVNDTSGSLTALSGSPLDVGAASACRGLAIEPSGRFAYCANFAVDSVQILGVNQTSGVLSTGAAPAVSAGDGPILAAADPTGRFLYVTNYYDNKVSAYRIDPVAGGLTALAGSPFGAGTNPRYLAVDPSGRYLYVSNSAGSNIYGYSIDSTQGTLTALATSPFTTGANPRGIQVHPSGKFVFAAQYTASTVRAMNLDQSTGALTFIANYSTGSSAGPWGVGLDPSGMFVYVTNYATGTLQGFTVNPQTGVLSPVGSAFPVGSAPMSVVVRGWYPEPLCGPPPLPACG